LDDYLERKIILNMAKALINSKLKKEKHKTKILDSLNFEEREAFNFCLSYYDKHHSKYNIPPKKKKCI
jgi:hypothetical protein